MLKIDIVATIDSKKILIKTIFFFDNNSYFKTDQNFFGETKKATSEIYIEGGQFSDIQKGDILQENGQKIEEID